MENKYIELVNKIKNIYEGNNNLTQEEKRLLKNIVESIRIDRINKISNQVLRRNSKLNELIYNVNDLLSYYINGLDYYGLDYRENAKYKIRALNTLKSDIYSFIDDQYVNNTTSDNFLVDRCVNSINYEAYEVPTYFNELVATRNKEYSSNQNYIVNEKIINRLYDLLSEEGITDEIEKGIDIISSKEKYATIIDKCELSLGYKDLIYNNINLIIDYNKTIKEIEEVLKEKRSKN